MKPIRLSAHALGYVEARGFNVGEVERAIREATWKTGDRGKLECVIDVPFGRFWNGTWYAAKRIRPIFVDEPTEIVVITVYTYFLREGAR